VFPVHIYWQSITDHRTKTIPKNETQVQSSSNTLKLPKCSQTNGAITAMYKKKIYSSIHGSNFCHKVKFVHIHNLCVSFWDNLISPTIINNGSNEFAWFNKLFLCVNIDAMTKKKSFKNNGMLTERSIPFTQIEFVSSVIFTHRPKYFVKRGEKNYHAIINSNLLLLK